MQSLYKKLELLNKNELAEICNKYSIDNKIYTYNSLNNIIKTNKLCNKFDMIELIDFFIKSKEKKIVYYNFVNSKKPFNEFTNITFKNINLIRNFIKKYYKQIYNLDFEYDKKTYLILKKYWSSDNPISIKKFCNIYYTNNNIKIDNNYLKNNYDFENIKNDIISYIDEYIILTR